MSLKESDWKAILDKPKNVGLKAGGTGISKALRDADAALKKFLKDHGHTQLHKDAIKAHEVVVAQCTDVINKHKKLFTEACTHLEKVKTSAAAQILMLKNETDMVAAKGSLRYSFQELWPKLMDSTNNAYVVETLDEMEAALKRATAKVPYAASVLKQFQTARTSINNAANGKACRSALDDIVLKDIIEPSFK